MNQLRIVGDVHGNYDQLDNICHNAEVVLQVGDLGFNYRHITDNYDPHRFYFIGGNHCNWDELVNNPPPHYLGRFGFKEINGFFVFFISGAFSIDWQLREKYRLQGLWPRTWWTDEELDEDEMDQCELLYSQIKPDLVVSHDCPRSIVHNFSNPNILEAFDFDPNSFTTRTSEFLENLFQLHQPKDWYFGHYHRRWNGLVNGTNFQLVNELGYIDI